MPHRHGSTNIALVVTVGSVVVLGLLIFALMNLPDGSTNAANHRNGQGETTSGNGARTNGNTDDASPTLEVYCAAGMKNPIEEAAERFQAETGIEVQLQYGGSGTLLSNMQIAKRGDLYIAADQSYIDIAHEKDLLDEALPLARMRPVIAVRKGNPKRIQSIDDLLRDDVSFGLANPEAASVGKLTQNLLEQTGQWNEVKPAATVFKATVNEIMAGVLIGSLDAAVIWDALVRQQPDQLEAVHAPAFDAAPQDVTIGVLRTCDQPARALLFARYLQATGKGQEQFAKFGFETVEGDAWAETPELVLFSGGVNRLAIRETLEQFQQREGVEINTVYNGCGILVADMKSGSRPDAYFACDASFMTDVQDLFGPPLTLSETDMVIIVKQGNPQQIQSLGDLTRDGLRIGVANEAQSALGGLTADLLKTVGLYDGVRENVDVETPTADMLVLQLLEGGLDAAIVYRANVPLVKEDLEVVPIAEGRATAEQPIAVSKTTKHPYLARRLVDALTSAPSRRRFESVNFRWRVESRPVTP